MERIIVDVWLYGPLARYGGEAAGRSFANLRPELPACSRTSIIPSSTETGVAFFHLKSMWPSQYRDGAALAPGLARAMSGAKDRQKEGPRAE